MKRFSSARKRVDIRVHRPQIQRCTQSEQCFAKSAFVAVSTTSIVVNRCCGTETPDWIAELRANWRSRTVHGRYRWQFGNYSNLIHATNGDW